jgi:hypothetical protein
MTMEIKLPDNTTDTIHLIPACNMASVPTTCLYSGKLEHNQQSVVAVLGCKESQEVTISIASSKVPGGMVDLSIVDGLTYLIKDDVKTSLQRRRGIFISKNDFLIPPPIKNAKSSARSTLPNGALLKTSIRYDNTLLNRFGGSHTKTKQWINSVVELAKPRMSHVAIHLQVVGDIKMKQLRLMRKQSNA